MKHYIFLLAIIALMCGCANQLPSDLPECAQVDKSLSGASYTVFAPTTEKTKCGGKTVPIGGLILSIIGEAL